MRGNFTLKSAWFAGALDIQSESKERKDRKIPTVAAHREFEPRAHSAPILSILLRPIIFPCNCDPEKERGKIFSCLLASLAFPEQQDDH
jgi:hypothetical protein